MRLAQRNGELSSRRLFLAAENRPEATWATMGALLLRSVVLLVKANARVGDDAESAESAATVLARVVWFARVDQSLKNPNAVAEGPFGGHAGQIQPVAADVEGLQCL